MNILGLYHRVDYDIMDHAAALRGSGKDIGEARKGLKEYALKIGIKDGVVKKRIQPAMKVWLNKNDELSDEISKIYVKSKKEDKLALNLGLMFKAYPAFYDVCSIIGSTGKLSETVEIGTIRNRMERKYGQTSSVNQMVRKSIQSLLDWNIITHKENNGIYGLINDISVGDFSLEIVVYGILKGSSRKGYPLDDILRDPSLFLFNVKNINRNDLRYLITQTEGNSIMQIYIRTGL